MPKIEGIDRHEMIRWAGPSVGQHTKEILSQLGYPEAQIDELYTEGVI